MAAEFKVSVREFVEFVYRTGNLGGEGKFLARDRGVEGTRGHRKIQRARGEGYQAEAPLEYAVEREGVSLKLAGRIDGVMAQTVPPMVEEIKTVEGDWDGEADPLHFAQLRIYAAVLAEQNRWTQVDTRLTYLNLDTDIERTFAEIEDASTLAAFLSATLERWFEWLIPQAQWKATRDATVLAMSFPFGGFRAGQRSFSAAVYRTIRDGGRLFAEAPTGTGKTLATLFPAAKALPLIEGQIFYITAKTPGRLAAEEAVEHLRGVGARLRSVSLTAKKKVCFNAGATGCDLRTCPFALGYFDRYKPAVRALLDRERIDRVAIEDVAREHNVCPFELSLDASVWTDVVIGDFNYVFDPTARLQRHFEDAGKRHVVLVDEAHNLVDRSREMYSASLSIHDLELDGPPMKGLGSRRARNAFTAASRAIESVIADRGESALPARDFHEGGIAAKDLPDDLIMVLRESAATIEGFLAEQPEGTDLSAWMEPWFAMLTFLRAADAFDDDCWSIIQPHSKSVKIFCADASKRLAETLSGLRAIVFFSATLSPSGYFRKLLGGEENDVCLGIESPFGADQMRVTMLSHDVTFRGREASMSAVAKAVLTHVETTPGNHLVFAPSFAYLTSLAEYLETSGLRLVLQSSGMDEAARAEFLAHFAEAGDAVGLAVLGGVFAEGIDLPGERVVGVTVIGIGLPRLSIERDILQHHFEKTIGSGFDYAYRFPGMQRVLQAVGRLIRTENDRGSALLIDRRYSELRTKALLPTWWIARRG